MAQHPSQWRQDPGAPPWSDDDQKPQDNPRPYSPVAETLFRKDLISAMKLPDNEPLDADDYWVVGDTWKQEWERGVQVPVKPDGLPEPHVSALLPSCKSERFALPRKLICMNTAGSYKPETHQVTPMVLRAEQVCTYDLDNVDKNWLEALNGERSLSGLNTVTESEMEKTVEEFEKQCREKINSTLRNTDDLDIAQDDSIICDVCRSPDSEESNEMVFCDKCNICVHQACYGITTIPSGSWLCRTCTLGIKPPCELCPNKGGAMKSTRTGTKWAHVSCALWIPEVSIGDVEKMEPITKISSIPPSRWSLVCVLCKEKMGACIQCSVKTCKTAYHVTCAFKHNLEMRAIIEDENAEDGVKLRSYCQKHSLNSKKKAAEDSDSESGLGRKSNMTPEEKSQARRQKMAKIEREFYKLVDLTLAARKIGINDDVVEVISKFWMLKRKAGGNKPLIPPRGEDESLSSLRGEDTERDKMKQLVNIRQDLERVRNLAYMVSRREKLSRSFVKLREQILEKQLALIADDDPQSQMSLMEMSAVLEANHGPTVYDKMFSNPESEQHSHEDFEMVICRIAGEISEGRTQIRKDNPFRKKSTETAGSIRPAPYERIFSDTNESESDDSFMNISRHTNKKRESGGVGKKSKPITRSDSSMSSGEEENALKNLSPTKSKKNIYSDSESEAEPERRGPGRPRGSKKQKEVKKLKKTESISDIRFDSEDTQNSLDIKPKEVRTKAAMKEFNLEDIALAKKIMEDKARRASDKFKNKTRQKEESDNDSFMDVDLNPSLLVVSQRSAARKAEQKISKKTKDSKSDPKQNKKGSKTADLFGTSDEDSSLSQLVAATRQRHRLDDIDPLVRKSPRRSSEHKKKHTSTDSESDSDDALRSSVNKVTKLLTPSKREKLLSDKHLSKSPKKSSKTSSLENKKKQRDSSDDDMFSSRNRRDERHHNDFDDLFDKFSGSDSDGDKKKLFDDFEHPEVYSDFVPQRKAAKKASAQLSEQNVWRKTQQEAYMAELAKQTEAVSSSSAGPVDKRKGKKEKKESQSESDVTRRRTRSSSTSSSSSSSSSSEEDSDRRKSPRGRGRSPKGLIKDTKPSKDSVRNQTKKVGQKVRKPRIKKSPRGDGEGKISSSKALEYLLQRESQASQILTELRGPEQEPEPEAATPQPSLDKKLKTSEGRAEGVQSPPPSPKDSSDSGSDSSSADSIILGIKARQKAEAERPAMFSDSDSSPSSNQPLPLPGLGLGLGLQEDGGGPGGRPRDRDDQSVEGLQPPGGAHHHPTPAQSEQHKPPGTLSVPAPGQPGAQKKSIFSPDRSPRPAADKSRGSEGSLLGREHDSSWKSPREWKFSESSSTGREVSAAPGSTTKSPALNRSYEGSRSSPMQQHRSPGFGRSPARHSQHPLNKSLDLNKSSDNLSKSEVKKTEENTVTSERDSSRKFSVESKDSDVDSAKSSLPDASMNGLPDFSKEDSTDTLFFGDKHGDNKQKTEQAPTKKDEGYVSAEKDQNDNAQEAVGKQRDGLSVVTNDKVSPHKNFKRLSTDDPNNGSQDQAMSKQGLWPDIFGQSGGSLSVQQQLLDGQQRSRQHQKHDITNTLENIAKDDNKNVADAFATQQQHLEALLMNQMFNHQRKSGHESISQQSTLAYMQQYMKELGGYNTQALQASQAYQQQILLQQMQQQAQALGLKAQDSDYQMYHAMYQAQTEAWYHQKLQEEQKRQHDEKMIQEERRKQEERRLQEEKKKLEDKRRKEEMFRQEEMKRQEEQKKKQEEKRREEEERKKKEEDHKLLIERLQKEEETRQMEKQKRVEEQRRLEEHRLQQENQRLEYQRFQNMRSQGYAPELIRQQQEYFANPFSSSDKHLGTVGQVEAQLGAWFGKEPGQTKKGPGSPSQRARPSSPKAGSGVYNVPSATPADQLPGFVPTREHKRQSHESHKDRDTPQSVTGSDNSAPTGIPNELLDSVLETAKLPVWKPPDKGDQTAFSPAKVSQSPSKPAPVPATERDSTFDDLVRHIDCSPSQKPDGDNDKLRPNKYNLLTDQASASEAERSDYDNDGLSMGGVDYDDPDDDYPKQGKLPQKKVAGKAPSQETVTRRGTKVPCYAEKTEEELEASKLKAVPVLARLSKAQRGRPGRVFGGRKGLKIDQKAIEKVHKNLVGTDFDFENEFDDDFGASPKQEMKSLKGFREQTKKAPIYMKESETGQDQVPPVPYEEEEFALEEKAPEKFISTKNKGRPKKVVESEPSDTVDVGDSKEFPKFKISLKNKLQKKAEDDVEEILEKVEKPKPKIPTLKIKLGRNSSPASIEEDEAESKPSKKRRSSVDKSGDDPSSQHQRIPKLKIKFGGIKDPESGRDEAEREFEEPSPLVIRSGTTPTSSPRNKQRTPTHSSKPTTPASERLSTSELALESLKSDIAKSSPRSASLTSTSHPAGRSSLGDTSSDLQKIFGSDEPLPVGVMNDNGHPEAGVEMSEDGPSELDLLALELSNQLAKDKQRKAAEEASKKEPGSSVHHHDPKYKFKQLKQSQSEGDAPNPPTPVKNNLSQASAASAADSNPLRRMRKKELLNQYYGIEVPPQAPPQATPVSMPASNGPLMEPPPPPSNHNSSSTNNRMVIGIKMPKAVASVTSVPTRADYQQQLEANLERKRKREGKEDYKKGKGSKSGKGGKKNVWEEPYKPKIKMNPEDAEAEGENSKEVRRTRGKPPKKCLAVDDSPERDPVESFIENKKNESLRYAEEVLATFDKDEDKSERRRKDKKKRRRDAEDSGSQPNSKTPRIVIKFSKNKETPASNKNIPTDNGLIKAPGSKESNSSEGPSLKLPKLKIKNLIEPSTT